MPTEKMARKRIKPALITVQRDIRNGCIRLHSYGKASSSLLGSMYDNAGNMFDVTLIGTAPSTSACDLQPIRAHKAILGHASSRLRDLFTSQGYVDSNKSSYTLSCISHECLRNILKFVYNDNVKLSGADASDRVRDILTGAKYLLMRDLVDACETYLAGSDQIDMQNCVNVFKFACKHQCSTMSEAVSAFIGKHLPAIVKLAEFLELKQNECEKLLLSDAFVAVYADHRCRAAIAWLNHDSPSRAGSAECIMSMVDLNAADVLSKTKLLAAQSAVVRPTIKQADLVLIDALTSNLLEQRDPQQNEQVEEQADPLFGEAWYVIGGLYHEKAVYRYDVAHRQWSTLAELPWERCCHNGACAIDKRVIILGGRKNGSCRQGFNASADIDEFDTVMQTWSTSKARLSCAREDVAVTSDGKNAYALGGSRVICDGSTFESKFQFQSYSGSTGKVETLSAMQTTRHAASAVCNTDGSIFVAGGHGHDTVDKYNPVSQKWSTAGKLSHSIAGDQMAAAFLQDDLYLITCNYHEKRVSILDTGTGQFRTAPDLKCARYGCSAVPLNEHVLCVLGGYKRQVQLGSVEVFDDREGKWSVGVVVPDMPCGNAYFGCARVLA